MNAVIELLREILKTLRVTRGPTVVNHGFDADGTQVIAADGTASVTFGPYGNEGTLCIERIVVSSASAAATTASVYQGANDDPELLRDFTDRGNADVADEFNVIKMPAQRRVLIKWVGGTPGAKVSANIQWRIEV